ncbi:MAG: extracellular solute-binding protein [Acholeplasmatales bacterium]|jgi:spermidine/putrescine transport system substrate-binding protein|nr:extracellular solute-binding protein [Acholeplasmatales bacterium]
MKKVLLLVGCSLLALVLVGCKKYDETIKVFLPTEYISDDLIKDFEDEYHINVEKIEFESNELAIAQIESGSFDVVIPSDYAIEELASKNLLKSLDWSKVEGFNTEDFDTELTTILHKLATDTSLGTTGFNLLNYAAPYFWGNVGLIYDKTKVNIGTIVNNGWGILGQASSTQKIALYESARDMFMIALKWIFSQMNSSSNVNNPSVQEIVAAGDWLKAISSQGANVKWVTDDILDDMLNPNATKYAMSVAYSGDAIWLMSENPNLGYYVPSQGTNVFVDAMCIPNNAKNESGAYKFISYFLSHDVQYANSEEWGYTSVRGDVIDEIISDGVYPSESYRIHVGAKDEIFRYNPTLKEDIDRIWLDVRS